MTVRAKDTESTESVASAVPDPRRVLPAGLSTRERTVRITAAVIVAWTCVLFSWNALTYVVTARWGTVTAFYTVVVIFYVLSRFILSAFYRPPRHVGYEPTIAIVVPSFNEGEAVARTVHSCMSIDYPRDKLELIVVNDGSTDDTWDHMLQAAAQYDEGVVLCVDLGRNQGKRAAMAAGIRLTQAEILVFVDSDSMPAPESVRQLVQGLADPRVGAVSGITHVRNAVTNALTRMQMTRYFVSFQLLKAAESVVGAVSCCSGCFAAYRRASIVEVLDDWERQTFLGAQCTHGDDRALTNMLIRNGWRTIYDSSAEAWTDAPDRYRKFFRQQLRWKKSWSRESPILLSHVWRSRPIAFPFVLMGTVAGLLSPLVLLINLALPFISGQMPVVYLLGLFLVSMAYALFYRAMRDDGLWLYGFVGTVFYIAFSFQLWWAIIRIRDGAWGTRPSMVGSTAASVPTPAPAPAVDSHLGVPEFITAAKQAHARAGRAGKNGAPSTTVRRPPTSRPARSGSARVGDGA